MLDSIEIDDDAFGSIRFKGIAIWPLRLGNRNGGSAFNHRGAAVRQKVSAIMETLKVIQSTDASITVQQWPEGHRWDFPVIVLDDNRRCLAHADFQAARDTAVGSGVSNAAFSLAEAEAYKRHLIG